MAEVWYTAPFGMIDWPWIALENHGWEVQWGAYGDARRLGRLVSSAAAALALGPEFRRGSRRGHLAECAVWRDYPYYRIAPAIAIALQGAAVIYLLNRVNRLEQVLALQTWTLDITKRHAALLDRMLAKQFGISNHTHPHRDMSPILTSLFKPGELLPPDKLLERIDEEG